jgi:Tfp pilus assembly protein FimT
MLIVIVILAIAAAIVVPMASSAGGMQVRAAANMVAADLEYAKSIAITRGQPHRVVFDKANETYQIVDLSTGSAIAHPVNVGSNYVINFATDGRLAQVDIVDADFDGGTIIMFNSLGSPFSTTGPLNTGTVTLQAGGVTRTVSVEPVTGFISAPTN